MAIYKLDKPTKDGRLYYFRKSKNGKQYESKAYKTKEECAKAESLFILKNESTIKKNFDLVALDYFKHIKETKKESTYKTYISKYNLHISPFFKSFDINSINIQMIRKWSENMLKKGLALEHLNSIYNILKNIFDFAMKYYNLESNPVAIYGRFQVRQDEVKADEEKLRYITFEEFTKFISVVNDPLWFAFFTTAYYSGCRKGELMALNWNDIDFDNNEIIINKTLTLKSEQLYSITSTKTNKNRKIKMNKTLRECLLEYKKEVMKYTDFSNNWFVFGNSRFLPTSNITRVKHKYFELSGVHEITMHEFRHSCVSLLINEYVKVSKEKNMKVDMAKFFLMMSDRMGHTVEVMQKTYMHLFPTMQDEIVDLLDNL